MAARTDLFVRPISWSAINPSSASVRANPGLVPSIQIFGYTHRHQTIYLRVPRNSTFVIKFDHRADEELVNSLTEILSPISIHPSQADPSILIVRGPEISPFDLSQDDGYGEIATWERCEQDPMGEIQSFWAARNIGPYDWLRITDYRPLARKYANTDLNLVATEEGVHPLSNPNLNTPSLSIPNLNTPATSSLSNTNPLLPEIKSRLFFWDIETFASRKDEFPNSQHVHDVIFMISVITVSGSEVHSYVIVKTEIPVEQLNRRLQERYGGQIPFVLIAVRTELELLNRFFNLYETFRPDRQIYYNGDMFDMPYVLDRLAVNGKEIPQLSKIPTYPMRESFQRITSPFGLVDAKTVKAPGTEIVDLLYYYRRFYPYFTNHRLDTVANTFIGEGKTGLTIDAMMEAVRTDDPESMVDVIDYSFIDSLRMQQLWAETKVENKLEKVCSRLGVDISTLLHENYDTILNQAVYNIDAGAFMTVGGATKPDYMEDARPGIYHNIFVYDYCELYRQLMLRGSQPIIRELAKRLKGAPSQLIMKTFFSGYVDRTRMLQVLLDEITRFKSTNTIISIDATTIRTINPIKFDYLKLVNVFNCYISLTNSSYITLDETGMVQRFGTAKLCRPTFALASDIIDQYVRLLCANSLLQFKAPDYLELPLEQFTMVEKIENIQKYAPTSLKYELAKQHQHDIITWVKVKYVQTITGPKILSTVNPSDTLDYNFYVRIINDDLTKLRSLKDYR